MDLEIKRWLDFRWHQFKARDNSQEFDGYSIAVNKFYDGQQAVELRLSRQTKLDEWREYIFYEHQKHTALEEDLNRAERKLKVADERAREAKYNGLVGMPSASLEVRWGELARYDEKISKAQNWVHIVQKWLEVLKVEESLSPFERETFLPQLEEELGLAQKAGISHELEQLKKEAEQVLALEALATAQGMVDHAHTRLEYLVTWLHWVSAQVAGMAAESTLHEWEKYYIRMRDKLASGEARVDGDPWFEQMYPERTEKWLTAYKKRSHQSFQQPPMDANDPNEEH
ncbi:hypothetical protein EJ07DRAFT_179791 [Lizonia empirigonia]|nr:hypothetical protein EJ07DRAFT_179791 [Lizonia empirigonia]